MKFGTKAIHAGVEPDPSTGAIMTPIFQTSTYVLDGLGKDKGYQYSRTSNPTRSALEQNLAALENGKFGMCFGSGIAAIDALMKTLNPGDEVVSTNDLYGGSYRLFTTIIARYGVKFHFVDMRNPDNVKNAINENTKLLWVETPTNPMLNIVDIRKIAAIGKEHNINVAVDNTFASPCLQNPLDLGADIVMHSVTKFIGGHSDVLMGALVVKDDDLAKELYTIQNSSGAVCGPQDAFLALRGIKTLHLRMREHSANGRKVATYLKNHPAVGGVYWPGLPDHPNHDIAASQMSDFGGMLSFKMKEDTKEAAVKILEKFKLFSLAESLGGVESLCGHPATMTHAAIPKEEREKSGITDSLIRLSVGIEHIDDIIADLENALS